MTNISLQASTVPARGLLALLPLALAAVTAQAATDSSGQILTLTPNADETAISIYWLTSADLITPPAPCENKPFTLNVMVDGIAFPTISRLNQRLAKGPNGRCILQMDFSLYGARLPPGVWGASAKRPSSSEITETQTIYACTPLQGKQPMYRLRTDINTDNFYTISTSDRDIAIAYAGYYSRGVPFAMPSPTNYGGRPFYRYYKSAPQYEHFYTHLDSDRQYVEQNGYVAEGYEGYLFPQYKPGSTALYRYSLFNSANGDLQHYYTINPNDPEAAGWGPDGVVGYVCPP
jgi:hypothetical protein